MLLAKNRKAYFAYTIVEKFLAGIVLKGHEVKAIREGKVSFEGSYIDIIGGKAVVKGLHIGRYSKQSTSFSEEDTKRDRELLLNKQEIAKISREVAEKGNADA